MGAEAHQFVDPLLKLFVDGVSAGFDGFETTDRFLSAVGHVDDELVVGAEGEAVGHGWYRLWVAGEWSSPMSLR